MSSARLELRSIDQLIDHAFVIPSYQRGYRWSKDEVHALLNDLEEFVHAKRAEPDPSATDEGADTRSALGRFYCLQPIVVLPRTDDDGTTRWELIDGQQRLTTIYLIIHFLKHKGVRLRGSYSLSYETRDCAYLDDPRDEHRWETPDAFYMHAAYEAIREWFDDKDFYSLDDIRDVLLLPDERSKYNTKVIWYQLPEPTPGSQAEIDAFIRLNAGKIRLTNAELIRALFLKAGNFRRDLRDLSQIKLAQEWDQIEKGLQDDRFWFFLHGGPSPYATRIDHLFRVHLEAAHGELLAELPKTAEFRTFLGYQELEKRQRREGHELEPISEQWDAVKHLAMRLQEWHEDRVLYHLVGFWITLQVEGGADNASVLVDLLARRDKHKQSHQDFEEGIKADIFRALIVNALLPELEPDRIHDLVAGRLDKVSYGNPRVRPLLLLFNIATLLLNGSSTVRFPFDLFQRQKWDIEHIRSVDSSKPGRPEDQKRWLDVVVEYWTGHPAPALLSSEADPEWLESVREQVDPTVAPTVLAALNILAAEVHDKGAFDEVYAQVLNHLEEDEAIEANNAIGNLALLDSRTNRSYRNAPFPVKRKRILALDKTGTFVPRCTTNVFLKYYSRRLDHLMTWTDGCADAYQAAMATTLAAFFAPGGHRPPEVRRG